MISLRSANDTQTIHVGMCQNWFPYSCLNSIPGVNTKPGNCIRPSWHTHTHLLNAWDSFWFLVKTKRIGSKQQAHPYLKPFETNPTGLASPKGWLFSKQTKRKPLHFGGFPNTISLLRSPKKRRRLRLNSQEGDIVGHEPMFHHSTGEVPDLDTLKSFPLNIAGLALGKRKHGPAKPDCRSPCSKLALWRQTFLQE